VKAFESIHQQSMEFFDRIAVGQLISRITNDTNRLARTKQERKQKTSGGAYLRVKTAVN